MTQEFLGRLAVEGQGAPLAVKGAGARDWVTAAQDLAANIGGGTIIISIVYIYYITITLMNDNFYSQ